MKRSVVTWRLSLHAVPQDQELIRLKELLAPIVRIERPPDYGVVYREFGLSDHLFIEPEAEIDAAEIALSCLTKAHRLAKGWSVMWPGFRSVSPGAWPAEEVERARRPESFSGLSGMFTGSGGRPLVEGLETAAFTVAVSDEDIPAQAASRPSSARPGELAPAATGPDAVAMMTGLVNLLVAYRSLMWAWDAAGARRQIAGLGYRPAGEDAGGEVFAAAGSPTVRMLTEGARVRWIEFILLEHRDPHLLDETAFDRKRQEFEAIFSAAVHAGRSLLGEPAFAGASGDHGFPRDQWADFAAVWPGASGRILIEQKHNDRELPLELCLVFAP